MAFPRQRLRRLRQIEPLRRMVRETRLSTSDLIAPFFVTVGRDRREAISSMPGQYRLSVDLLVKEAGEVKLLGIPAVLLFGIPDRKDERGTAAYDPNGIVQQAVRALKDQVPGLLVVTDVCIDEYTSHGHCGLVQDGRILNDETLECLQAMARQHAQEGADIVMVKPAMPCLDIIAVARSRMLLPIAAYQVSGEYSMIKAAARAGWLNETQAMMESLLSIKRAGADLIVTYFAKEAARLL